MLDIKKSVEDNGGSPCFVFLSPNLHVLQQRISAPSRIGKKADTIDNSDLTPHEAAERIVEYYQGAAVKLFD